MFIFNGWKFKKYLDEMKTMELLEGVWFYCDSSYKNLFTFLWKNNVFLVLFLCGTEARLGFLIA